MGKQKPKAVKGIAEGHIGISVEEMVQKIGTQVTSLFSLSQTYLPWFAWIHHWFKYPNCQAHQAPWEGICLAVFTDTLYLGIIGDVIKQEIMSFTENFPHKSKNAFSTTLVFFQPQFIYIFLSKGMCFMHKLASVLLMLNLYNQYNNKRNGS